MSQFKLTSSGNLKIEDFPLAAGAVKELIKKEGETCPNSSNSAAFVGELQMISEGLFLIVTGSEHEMFSSKM